MPTGGELDTSTDNLLAYVGSAAGAQGHGRTVMLNLSTILDQAAGPCAPGPAGVVLPPPCPSAPAAPALPNPKTVAQGIPIPWPDLELHATPERIGLTGLPSWFWIDGYAGQPLTASTHIHLDGLPNSQAGCPSGPSADMDVAVQATPIDYSWRFGGALSTSSTDVTSLGVPYPQKDGAITHLFEVTSSASGYPDGYPIRAVAHFSVRYATDGGGWQPLTETNRQASLTYKVQQVYPTIVR